MDIQVTPNRWSCLPVSLAMLVGRHHASIFKTIGHDGSEIRFPNLEEPFNRRGFELFEIIDAALQLGFAAIPLEVSPRLISFDDDLEVACLTPEQERARLERAMNSFTGICCGTMKHNKLVPHACAWDGMSLFDPTGFVYPSSKMDIDIFIVVVPIATKLKDFHYESKSPIAVE